MHGQTFLDVITGNAAGVAGKGNGKVLKSTAEDRVFINFADHGGTVRARARAP